MSSESPTPPVEPKQQRQFPCKDCGANLQYEPGQTHLKCPYCAAENEIAVADAPIEELDFHAFLADAESSAETISPLMIKCEACGAESSLPPNVTADKCPFCGNPIVAQATTHRMIKPQSLLPFHIKQPQAMDSFRKWVESLWFAPSDLKKFAEAGGIKGVYIPYWTYDSDTTSQYRGERGDDYQDTESYTTTENGQTVTRTRTVTKTRWWPVSGRVSRTFDDVLIPAADTLPPKFMRQLEPWDLQNLVPYTDAFLAGFLAEAYQVGLEAGFGRAKDVMDEYIRQDVRRDIGGDHQRIHSLQTRYDHITFKHILLPLWLSAYRYRDKSYRFLVNARNGTVCGERPYSAIKITLFVLMILIVIGTVIYFFSR